MALIDLCRLDEKINLRPVDSLASFQNDVLGYSQNFVNSAQLAAPPFSNVSKGYNAVYFTHCGLKAHNSFVLFVCSQ